MPPWQRARTQAYCGFPHRYPTRIATTPTASAIHTGSPTTSRQQDRLSATQLLQYAPVGTFYYMTGDLDTRSDMSLLRYGGVGYSEAQHA